MKYLGTSVIAAALVSLAACGNSGRTVADTPAEASFIESNVDYGRMADEGDVMAKSEPGISPERGRVEKSPAAAKDNAHNR